MTKILSIETSTQVCSVAIHAQGALVSNMEVHAERSHARFLTHIISECSRVAGIPLAELDAIAVSKGPGSYTGLRIGVSTAKGLCFSLDKPLVTVNTLEAMAWQVLPMNYRKALLLPMLDARRMEVYAAVFDAQGNTLVPTEAHIITAESFTEYAEELLLFGNGAPKCKGILDVRNNVQILEGIYPSAIQVGVLATNYYEAKQFSDLAYFEPFYLKDFVRLGQEGK